MSRKRPLATAMAAGLVVVGGTLTGCAGGHPAPRAERPPELYGAGLFSTGAWDFFLAFSPDQRRALFCRANDDFTAYQILETRRDTAGRWGPPARLFGGEWSDADPHIAPDGQTLFFVSNRPAPDESGPRETYDIWVARLGADGEWGQAERLPPAISVGGVDEWSPSVAANGDLYFGTERAGGRGGMDIWIARREGDRYRDPENLGDSINTAGDEVEPWISPDQSYLVFSAKGRADSVGAYDLYLSRRRGAVWRRARLLGGGVSTQWRDFNQSVSPDGRWLYFSSTRPHTGAIGVRFDSPRNDSTVAGIGNGKGDIYRVALRPLAEQGSRVSRR